MPIPQNQQNMPTLIINDDNGAEMLRVQIKRVEPDAATIAILKAIGDLPQPKKARSDAGKKRAPKLIEMPAQQVATA